MQSTDNQPLFGSCRSRLAHLAAQAGAILLALFLGSAGPKAAQAQEASASVISKAEQLFLDRLMQAESGGRLLAKNPNSSALGPFQFIRSTFLEVIGRHFPEVTDGKSDAEILELRVDPKIARDAALAYTRENASFLAGRGVEAQPAHLRLAFLVGPGGALKIISAEPDEQVSALLSKGALDANPFLEGMTAKQLIERSEREAAGLDPLPVPPGVKAKPARPQIRVRCNLGRASCRRWLSLAKKRAARKEARQAKKAAAQ